MRRRRKRTPRPRTQFGDVAGLNPEGEASQRMLIMLRSMR